MSFLRRKLYPLLMSAAIAGAAAFTGATAEAASNDQYVPLLSYRVGPYASSGIPIWVRWRIATGNSCAR